MDEVVGHVDDGWRIPEELWVQIQSLLPLPRSRPKGGRRLVPDRQCLDGIFYVLRILPRKDQWKAFPRCLGAASTIHDRFQQWRAEGVFDRLWGRACWPTMPAKAPIVIWAMDGAMTKAPFGGKGTGPNPRDRGKLGTKQSLLTEGHGIPIAVAVDGANRHDMKLAEPTLAGITMDRPIPTVDRPQHLSLDKGYDFPAIRDLVAAWGNTGHILSRGEEAAEKGRIPGYRARRWVVERTQSWTSRFRPSTEGLIRWEKRVDNYEAMLHLACGWITYRAAGVFG